MTVKKSQALSGVRVPSLDDLVDEFMEYIPRVYVNLDDKDRRDQMRGWIKRIMIEATRRMAEAHTDAVKNLMCEMTVLLHDPKYYEEKRKRRSEKTKATIQANRDREIEAARKLPVF